MFNIKQVVVNFVSDKKFSEIFKGSVWSFVAQVASALLSMVISVVTARFFGVESLGVVAIIHSFIMLASIFTVMGTGTSILRLIPEYIVSYSFASAYFVYRKVQYFVSFAAIVFGVVLFCFTPYIADEIFNKPDLKFYIALASFFVLFRSLMTLNTQAARGLRLIRTYALMQVLPALSNLFLLLILVFFTYNPHAPVYSYLFSIFFTALFGVLVMLFSFKKQILNYSNIYTISIKKIIQISFPMLMTASMNFVIAQTGIILLGVFKYTSDVGYYSVAIKLATLTTFILHAVNSMSASKFSELYHSNNTKDLFYIAKKSTKLIFFLTVPILVALLIFGKNILAFLYGDVFQLAYIPLIILVVGQFFNSISGSTGIFLNMTGHQIILRNIMAAAAILNIVLNLLLIPLFGITGAAIAAMLCTIMWNLIAMVFIKRKFNFMIGYFPNFFKIR